MSEKDEIVIPPSFIFIIPVDKSRKAQKKLLSLVLHRNILPKMESKYGGKSQVLFIEQAGCESPAGFNAGAMKNAGYLYIRSTYPDADLSKITMIFQDVDKWILDDDEEEVDSIVYSPVSVGQVKVFYLHSVSPPLNGVGGIFAINASDFALTGGFANLWGWTPDELEFHHRCLQANLQIDYSSCIPPFDKRIAHLLHPQGVNRQMNAFQMYRFAQKTDISEGLASLSITTWIENLQEHTLVINEFTTQVPDSPQHRAVVHLPSTPIRTMLERAQIWYRTAYTTTTMPTQPVSNNSNPHPPVEYTWATPDGVRNIRNFVKQFPRSRLQQLQK